MAMAMGMAAGLLQKKHKQELVKPKMKQVAGPSINILFIEMNEEMEKFSIDTAMSNYNALMSGEKVHMKDLAESIKQTFDEKYPGTWHIIVGKSFGSYVTHEVSSIIYFFIGSVGFLIFKHG